MENEDQFTTHKLKEGDQPSLPLRGPGGSSLDMEIFSLKLGWSSKMGLSCLP